MGIQVTQPEYSVTMDNIDLRDQRTTGLSNTDNEVSVENLTSTNTVPAVVNTDPRGMMTLVGASLVGGSGTYPAVENQGEIYIRGLTSQGYRTALSEHAVDIGSPSVGEYTTAPAQALFPPISQRSLNLPIADPPNAVLGPPSGWTSVATYGATPASSDNPAAIQAALDSGNSTIYFPPGQYNISHTLTVEPSVQQILGFNSTLYGTRGTSLPPTQPIPCCASPVRQAPRPWFTSSSCSPRPGSPTSLTPRQGPCASKTYTSQRRRWLPKRTRGRSALPRGRTGKPLDLRQPAECVGPTTQPGEAQWAKISNNGGTLWILGLRPSNPPPY